MKLALRILPTKDERQPNDLSCKAVIFVAQMRTIIINSIPIILGCVAGLITAANSRAAEHEYTVRFDSDLGEMHVEAQFAEPVSELRVRSREGGRFLKRAADCETGRTFEKRGRHLEIAPSTTPCIEYVVDLRSAAADERRNETLASDNIVVPPAVWLWRPPLDHNARIVLRFDLQDGMRASLPWPVREDGRYELHRSPRNAQAMAAFGRFEYFMREVPGSTIRIAVMRPRGKIDSGILADWVQETARTVSLTYGRFPNPSPHVLLLPVGRSGWGGDSPVPYGRVVRDGGEAVELFIDERRSIEDFRDDWTATHELSHLMLPLVNRNHRWITEGFAQYYQNVLLARAGQYDEQRAWQNLYEGFERGRNSRPELSPNKAGRAGVRAATMKIYWSGAILALKADVELRRRSGGRESLDMALERLQHCCLPSPRSWTGVELLQKLDSLVEEPVFIPLYRRYADAQGFPPFDETLEELGVMIDRGRVSLENSAELAPLRRAMTATD
jgi:hypothetical protein